MKHLTRRLRINSLAGQCTVAAAILSVVPLVLLSLMVSTHVNDALMAKSQEEFDLALVELEHIIQNKIIDRQQDLLTMTELPSVDGIFRAQNNGGIDPQDNSTLEQWRDRMIVLFTKYEFFHHGTLQIRYLDENGHEWLRVDRHGKDIIVAEEEDLQDKSDRPYFTEAIKLEPGQCHVSTIDLYEEHGVIQPENPVLRFSAPVWREGQLLGVMVMKVNANEILDEMVLSDSAGRVILSSASGVYMFHQDQSKRWSDQLKTDASLFSDWPQLKPWASIEMVRLHHEQTQHLNSQDQEALLSVSSLVFDDYNAPWIIGIELNRAEAIAAGAAIQRYVLWCAVVVGIVSTLLALLLAMLWVKPIKLLSQAADTIRSGDYTTRVGIKRRDELGELADSFNQMAAELEQVVEIKEQRARAEAANLAKSAFLANMSHEIRTPMNAILGFADLLASPEIDAETQNDYIQTIRRNGDHLMSIINDILDLSKIEAGKMDVDKLVVDPHSLVNDVMSLMQGRATQKNLKLDLELQESFPSAILTDPLRLRQILINLLGNAIKFTEWGSVRLHASWRPSEAPDDVELCFNVIDTGIGIEKENLDHLFKPFNQADGSMSRRFGGTGLGLALSKRFATMLGGDISATSTPGQGSTFSLVIRARLANEQQAIEQPLEREAPKWTAQTQLTGRALLAEDGKDNQRLIMFHLKKMGLTVELCENGKDAMDLALEHCDAGTPFDVIFMDMQMPVMDGYTATKQLRERGYTGPIIALTAHAMAGDRKKCIAAGCDEYTTKPIDKAHILTLLSRMLKQRRAA